MSDLPAALSKYLQPERTDVLLNLLIRFTPASALNDPFELQAVFDSASSTSQMMSEVLEEDPLRRVLWEQYRELPEAHRTAMPFDDVLRRARRLPENQALLDFMRATSVQLFDQLRMNWNEKLQRRIGILSLAEGWDNMRMWADYAAAGVYR